MSDGVFQYVPQADTADYGPADTDNGLTTESLSAGNATMSYDGNHNLTYDGYNTLTYDVENRVIQAENALSCASASPCTYLYDPLGQRKQKTVAGAATDFVLAGGEEIADYYEASASWRLTVRGAGGLPLAAVVPGASEQIVYVHHDIQGSTVALTTAGSSGPADTYTYSDYGQPQSGSWSAYQYAGYRYDSETGLYYVKARYYSPNLGRFMQSDPVGFRGGMNLYAYTGNDPISFFDPTGLSQQETGNDSGRAPGNEYAGPLFFGSCDAVVPPDPTTATLAQLVYAEGNGTPTSDLAVASVVENRVNSGSTGEFGSGIQGVMSATYLDSHGNFQFEFNGFDGPKFYDVANDVLVSNLSPAQCQSYTNAADAATLAQAGITNTNALYFYDNSIPQPTFIANGLQSGTVVPASVNGGANRLTTQGGGSGNTQYFFTKAGH